MKKYSNLFFTLAGHGSLALGIAGIFLPVLPTTPFLLLSAACYARGSKKFYTWLLTHKTLGPYVSDWRGKKGIPKKTKIFAISMLWLFITASAVFFVDFVPAKIILLCIAAAVTVYILKQPTKKAK